MKQRIFFGVQAVLWFPEFKRRSALSVLKLDPRQVDGVFQNNSSDSCHHCPGTGAIQSKPAKTLLLISCTGVFSNGVIMSQNLGIFLYRTLCLYIIYSVVMDSWYGYSSGVIMQAYETQPSMQLTSITHKCSYVWMYAGCVVRRFIIVATTGQNCADPNQDHEQNGSCPDDVIIFLVSPRLFKSFCSMAHLQGPCTSPQGHKRLIPHWIAELWRTQQ